MRIVEIRALQGANFWSKKPAVRMLLDMENLDGVLTNQVPGFTDRLVQLLPSLKEHRCTEKDAGGLVKIMNEGTPLYHVIEHIAIELQYLAYMDTTFCKTFPTKQPGLYQVVFEYWVEDAGIFVGEECVRIVQGIVDGAPDEDLDIDGVISEIKGIRDDHYLGPSTMAIVDEARRRDITVIRLDDYNLVQLGEGKHQKRIQASLTSNTSLIAAETASNKKLTKMMLEDNGIPVPPGTIARKFEHALEDAGHLGYPLVVKPFDGHHGKGITIGIKDEQELKAAFERAIAVSSKVVVEKMMVGNDYRILLVDGRFIAAAHRIPARIVGDGTHTLLELIEIENRNPKRGRGHENFMTLLGISPITEILMAEKGYTPETVLAADERFYLERTANLSTGGMAFDVSHKVHPANRFMFERVARIIGLDIAGLDVLAPTLETPIIKNGGVIIEVNAAPGLRMHLNPSEGKPRNVGAPILDMLYPAGSKHDIPIVSVTGTNGKTTTSYLTEAVLAAAGHRVGVIGTVDWHYPGKRGANPVTTPQSLDLQRILAEMRSAGVSHAVMEVSSHALDQDRVEGVFFDVGVFTNLTRDHLDYHGSMAAYRECKQRLFTERLPAGPKALRAVAVVNTDDPFGRELAACLSVPCLTVGSAVGNKVHPVAVDISRRGIQAELATPGGRLEIRSPLVGRHNLDNIMAAVASGIAVGVPAEAIGRGIAGVTRVPGRLEPVSDPEGRHVYIDYAHTPDALDHALAALRPLTPGRLICVFGCGGDRDTGKRPQMGEIAGRWSDYVVVTSDNPRSEVPEAIIEMILPGLRRSAPADRWEAIPDRARAIFRAIGAAGADDTVLIAGKGHETYQVLSNRTIDFDDRQVAQQALAQRRTAAGGP